MLLLRFLFTTAILHLASGSILAGESVLHFGVAVLTLPGGYIDNPGGGTDSREGDIAILGKSFKIHYDDFGRGGGPTKLSEFSKESLDSIFYYERVQDDPLPTCIYAWIHPNVPGKPIVTLEVLGVQDFHIQLSKKSDLQKAIQVLRAIKITKAR